MSIGWRWVRISVSISGGKSTRLGKFVSDSILFLWSREEIPKSFVYINTDINLTYCSTDVKEDLPVVRSQQS